MKRIGTFLLVIFACPLLVAQSTINPETIKKMVVFLYRAKPDGGVTCTAPGPEENGGALTAQQVETCVDTTGEATGFLIALPYKSEKPPNDNAQAKLPAILLLITARHVVDPAWACPVPEPSVIFMRLNRKNYDPKKDDTGVDYYRILLRNGKNEPIYFVRNDDDEVDAAVIDLGTVNLSQDRDDFIPLRLSSFASAEDAGKLRIGDEVYSAGLLPGKSGEKRNYPFFKFGAISNIPDEPVRIGCGQATRLERAWFIAANLAPGNSGSPLFYNVPQLCLVGFQCTNGITRGIIIGLQSSTFGDPVIGGEDIAGMTPIEDVYKIIQSHAPTNADLYRGDEAKRPKETQEQKSTMQ